MNKRSFKLMLENNKWLKKIPNLLTICNSLCGFAAILYTLHVYDDNKMGTAALAVSAWIIMFAMVFDALDGFAARIFNAASMKGLQMDSLADMVTFGVAPAVIVAVMAHRMKEGDNLFTPKDYILIWGVSGVYLGCAALRLANYNVKAMSPPKNYDGNYFCGLPSPGGAAAICSAIIFFHSYGVIKHITYGLPLYAATLGLLMISNIQYIHVGRWLFSVRRNKKRLFILCALLAWTATAPLYAIILIVNFYIFSGPVMAVLRSIGLISSRSVSAAATSTE